MQIASVGDKCFVLGRSWRILALLALVVAIAYASRAQTAKPIGPGPLRAAYRWLGCDVCEEDSKELKAVRSHGGKLALTLREALIRGPTPVVKALLEQPARSRYRRVQEHARKNPDEPNPIGKLTEQEYVEDQVAVFAAGYRLRAVEALRAIDGKAALDALIQAKGKVCGEDYLQDAIAEAIDDNSSVAPPGDLACISLSAEQVPGGSTLTAKIELTAPASADTRVALASNRPEEVRIPATVLFETGSLTASVSIATAEVASDIAATITASYKGVTKLAALTVNKSFSCYPDLPAPELTYERLEHFSSGDGDFTRYRFSVENELAFPSELFEPTPDLEVCGSNRNASRARIEVFDDQDNKLSNRCGDLSDIQFITAREAPPPEAASVRLTDRRCSISYESNLAPIDPTVPLSGDLASISPSAGQVRGGSPLEATIELTAPASANTQVNLTSDRPEVQIPATVLFETESPTASVSIATAEVASDITATISASYKGVTKSANLEVFALPADLASIWWPPWAL